MSFSTVTVSAAVEKAGLRIPAQVIDQLVASIDAGKHVILTGPPGTGKTTLSFLAAEVAQQAMLCTGFLPTTATTEWTTFETIGGFQPSSEGLLFRPGMFVEALESGRWLVIDELNRSNFDRAFGQLFTVLSGQSAVLPFKRAGRSEPVALVPAGVEAPPETDVIRVPASWRIIATMNVFDKNLLFEMSYALMRRFAFVEVTSPDAHVFEELLSSSHGVVSDLLLLRRFRDLGPAVYLDAARFADRRARDDVSRSRLLYETFYSYFLPQLEGADDYEATSLYRTISPMLDEPELIEVRRTIADVLGVELAL